MAKIVENPSELEINGNSYRVVNDYDKIRDCLSKGETIVHWEEGDSLYPIIKNREYCKISPIGRYQVKRGDVVFCKVDKWYMVHRVVDEANVSPDGLYACIGDTWGHVFGWTQDIYGIAVPTGIEEKDANPILDY